LLLNRTKSSIPRPVPQFQPLHPMTIQEAREMRINLQAYVANNQGLHAQFTPDKLHFVVDTGASITITKPKKIQGITSGLDVKGIGEAEYIFKTNDGNLNTVLFQHVLFVPNCTVCLLCP
jgi:hypothetical protein